MGLPVARALKMIVRRVERILCAQAIGLFQIPRFSAELSNRVRRCWLQRARRREATVRYTRWEGATFGDQSGHAAAHSRRNT